MKKGDIKKLNDLHGKDVIVEIVDLYDCDGIEYAEVKPENESLTQNVPVSVLKEVNNE